MFEMAEYLKTIPAWALIAIIVLMAYVLNGYWDDRKRVLEKRDELLAANTQAIMKLELQIEQLVDLIKIVPKLEADMDYAFSKIRDLENQDPTS